MTEWWYGFFTAIGYVICFNLSALAAFWIMLKLYEERK